MSTHRGPASEEGGGVYNNDGGAATVTGIVIMFNTPDNCRGTITGC